jgi:DNA-binding CsgD family transcriptional regulator
MSRLLVDTPPTRLEVFEEAPKAPDVAALAPLGLTRREAEVLAWAALGKANAEIAAVLGTSPLTVKKHLERVFRKLGVENRTAAARVAIDAARRMPLESGTQPRTVRQIRQR